MRVLFTTWGWPSHLYPLVQLAWAMQAAGDEVRVASQPGLAPAITQAGLTAVPVGTDVDVAPVLRPFHEYLDRLGRPIEISELLAKFGADTVSLYVELAGDMLDDTLRYGESFRPDVVVFEPTTFAGPLAAAALGVPAVRHIWGMDFTYLTHEYEPGALAPLASRLGLSTVDTLGLVTVDPCPQSLQAPHPVRRLPIRYAPYNGPAQLPGWLRKSPSRPRVCVTGGTIAGRFARTGTAFESLVVEALDRLDVEIVVVNPVTDDLPGHVRVVPRLAMHLLLPSCCLAVHSGGGGMAMTALVSGTPQLLVPRNPDHIFNAQRLTSAGAARMVYAAEATAAAIRDQAVTMLSAPPSTVDDLRSEMARQPQAAQVRDELLTIAGGAAHG
ncbi:MAG: DUF1205 domain-containing protein [Micromonosporaceae bacterium]|nr:DUF1205 domain-containing protein [Micromonosporaceae bacterium]